MDPHASPSAVTYQITSSVLEALLYQGLDGKVVPWLATGYTVSADGRSFTFTLRKDAQFSDGAPVNAAAVKWNFDRIVDPNFKAGGALTALTGYAGSTVVDESTVRVNFKEAYAPFLTYAAGGTLALISPLSVGGVPAFVPLFFVTVVCVYLYLGPFTAVSQNVVTPGLRAGAVTMLLLISHLFGDSHAPADVG